MWTKVIVLLSNYAAQSTLRFQSNPKTSISSANVQLIYHSVLSELLHDKRRKFTFSETSYFWRWWKEQRPVTRATFRTLVQEGRIEFAGGGWVHNDEATVDYLQIIDQYTWGLRKLNDTLGICGKPKAAWQIDTYGHTREQASLLAQMGYDGLFIGRVDHKERDAMIEEDRLEFMWRGSDVLGKMSDIMSHTLFNLYNAPERFCFDFLCNDEPIIDDPDSKVYNAHKRVNDFISQIEKQARYYDHDNIMVTMGGDFTYQSAANWFMNMDKLINHVNTHPANLSDINIFYSTPSCYLKAIYLYGRRDKADDLLPYGSDPNTYWTGFYTSRPSFKYLARRAHVFLQVVKQLSVIAHIGDTYELHLLRHAVSLILHHDTITGTSQQHVANDFIRILSEAIDTCTKKISSFISILTPTWGNSKRSKNNQQFVITSQFLETHESVIVVVYNPLSTKTYHHVKLPAVALHYSIRDYNDEEVEYQLVPLPSAVINLPGRSSSTIQELCFEAENIPPLGYSAYYITPIRDPLEENAFIKKKSQPNSDPDQEVSSFISNEYIKVTVNKDSGLLQSIQHVDGATIHISQNFFYYSQLSQGLQSGAYSFRPHQERPTPVTDRVTYHTIRGTLVKEIRQKFNEWITQIIRLYRSEEFVELEWIIGPVPIGTDLGKEVVSVFTTNITNNGEFFTDSNGRQRMKRSCWNETASQQQKKAISACYYPVTSRICIQSLNSSIEMCILTDRPQGGTSYNEGEIELMVHRRLLTDDGFGLEEALNEEEYGVGLVIKGKHRIVFGNFRHEVDDQTFPERVSQSARKWMMEPWLFLTAGDKMNRRKWQNIRNKRYSSLRVHGLPRHIHVLTLEPWKAGSVLLRLENTLETTERGNLKGHKSEAPEGYIATSHVTVDLRKIFLQLQVKMVRETTLAANQWLDDARQMDWSTRYVYNGADDGILAEDIMDYGDDKSTKHGDVRESERYSDEEVDYSRKKLRPKSNIDKRAKIKAPKSTYEYDRRKRSLNSTENINENVIIINEAYDQQKTEIDDNKTDLNYNSTTTSYAETNTFKNVLNKTDKIENRRQVKTNAKEVGSINKKSKQNQYSLDERNTGNIESDEEDLSTNLKKIRRNERENLKKTRDTVASLDDADDGVTKSIYDMYYKTTTKRTYPFKPMLRSLEEESRIRRKKKTRRYYKEEDYGDTSVEIEYTTKEARKGRNKKRRKNVKVDMPFFLNDGKRRTRENNPENRRRVKECEPMEEDTPQEQSRYRTKRREETHFDSQDYDAQSHSEYVDDEAEYDRRTEKRRKKRTIPIDEGLESPSGEQADQSDSEYIVTLRPTQIRTFVVWFESNRRNYVV
ncbi:lysosomal alpha-mannosidase-like [Galleria mellonella]|uniref:Lysosomal alpha-mannosidase-like n=1 Tax=Galleria mellonella TaxID=7137 RepID=A0ABM3MDD4_GALME|nr:lysosomal alpha-mannosidase-like [Galleria mellonella]